MSVSVAMISSSVDRAADRGLERGRRRLPRLFALWALAATVAVLPLRAGAAEKVYERGEYRFSVGPVPGWVEEASVPAKWDASAPGADNTRWRNWLIDSQIDRRAGARVTFRDLAFEPVSEQLVADAARFQMEFVPDYQRLILHRVEVRRGGAWKNQLDPAAVTLARRESEFEHDMATGSVTALLVLPDVRAGDVVRVSYTVEGENPILEGLDDDDFVFGWRNPILDRRARVLFSPDAVPATYAENGPPQAHMRKRKGALEWVAEKHGQAELVDEKDYPLWYSPFPRIALGEKRTWHDIAAWAARLYPPPAALPEELESRIAAWRELPDEPARIGAALRAVQDEVRYFGQEIGASTHRPAEPAVTWQRRYGDCKDKARLLSTVLTRLGIPARPALVSASRGRAIADLPPAASVFDHVIVEVPRAAGTPSLWLDPTQTQQRGSPLELAVGDFGVALPVGDEVAALVDVLRPAHAVDRIRVVSRYVPADAGTAAHLEVESEYTGYPAQAMRRQFSGEGAEAIGRRYADTYRQRYGKVELTTAPTLQEDPAKDQVLVKEHYLLADPWSDKGGGHRGLDIHADSISAELGSPHALDRRAPLALRHPIEMIEIAEVKLPAGWKWGSSGSHAEYADAAMRYESKTTPTKDGLRLEQSYRSAADVVTLEDLTRHEEVARQARDAVSRTLVFDLPAGAVAAQRDQRLQRLLRDVMDARKSDKNTEGQ
jgi:hypothetical protein